MTCEAGEIGQAVLNIVVNAAHAISDQVKGTERRGAIKIRTEQEAEFVVISIEDTGGGIPSRFKSVCSTRFSRPKSRAGAPGKGSPSREPCSSRSTAATSRSCLDLAWGRRSSSASPS